MTTAAVVGALAHLPDDAQITVSVRVADLRVALERAAGGPATLTTTLAAALLGFTSERWRVWCANGRVAGAHQIEEGGPWYFPRAAAEQHIEGLRRRGGRRMLSTASTGARPARGPYRRA